MEKQYAIIKICRAVELSSSGYYAWKKGRSRKREARHRKLSVFIAARFSESKNTYGPVRIHKDLKEEKIPCSRRYVSQRMIEMGLKSVHKRKYRITTDSDHALPIAPNILDRNFNPETLDTVYACDFTYIPTHQGWIYLAVVMDLCSRKIIGWSLKNHMRTELVLSALNMAINCRKPQKGLIHHSDQGTQYASALYRDRQFKSGMITSMSRKGNCWDNAPLESFFATLKKELIYSRDPFINLDQAKEILFDYIETFYNRKRRHSSLGYISPEKYEQNLTEKIKREAA